MRKPSSRFVLSTIALLGVAACTIVACGDDDTSGGTGTSSGGASDGGKDGSSSSSSGSSGTGSSSSGTSGTSGTSGGPTDASNDTGASSSGDSGNDSGTDAGDSGVDAGPDAADAGPDAADAGDAGKDSGTGSGGTCDIENGTYKIHFETATGTPAIACQKPADTTTEINHTTPNYDAGAGCKIEYDFVACTQKLHCDQNNGGFATTVDNFTSWTSTKISGTQHQVTKGTPLGDIDCTYTYTLTKQ